jgi:hypothetical protein
MSRVGRASVARALANLVVGAGASVFILVKKINNRNTIRNFDSKTF